MINNKLHANAMFFLFLISFFAFACGVSFDLYDDAEEESSKEINETVQVAPLDGNNSSIENITYIDVFEEDGNSILESSGGEWISIGDETNGRPNINTSNKYITFSDNTPVIASVMCVNGMTYSFWGALIEAELNMGDVFDASEYQGISVAAAGKGFLRLVLKMPEDITLSEDENSDQYGYMFQLTDEWQRFDIPFSSLSQIGWSGHTFEFQSSNLVSIQFVSLINAEVDYCLDHLGFY